jgi:hypothetical protein
MEVVTKYNHLVKCLRIFGGGCFYLRRRSLLTASQNVFLEAVKIVHVVKFIYGDSQNGPSNLYGGGQKMSISVKRPEADEQPTSNPNYKWQTSLSISPPLSLLLHLSAAAQMLGSLLRLQLVPNLPWACDSFPFSPVLATPRVEQ